MQHLHRFLRIETLIGVYRRSSFFPLPYNQRIGQANSMQDEKNMLYIILKFLYQKWFFCYVVKYLVSNNNIW